MQERDRKTAVNYFKFFFASALLFSFFICTPQISSFVIMRSVPQQQRRPTINRGHGVAKKPLNKRDFRRFFNNNFWEGSQLPHNTERNDFGDKRWDGKVLRAPGIEWWGNDRIPELQRAFRSTDEKEFQMMKTYSESGVFSTASDKNFGDNLFVGELVTTYFSPPAENGDITCFACVRNDEESRSSREVSLLVAPTPKEAQEFFKKVVREETENAKGFIGKAVKGPLVLWMRCEPGKVRLYEQWGFQDGGSDTDGGLRTMVHVCKQTPTVPRMVHEHDIRPYR